MNRKCCSFNICVNELYSCSGFLILAGFISSFMQCFYAGMAVVSSAGVGAVTGALGGVGYSSATAGASLLTAGVAAGPVGWLVLGASVPSCQLNTATLAIAAADCGVCLLHLLFSALRGN